MSKTAEMQIRLIFFSFLSLCRGADSQAMDRDGRTALQYAIDGGTSDDDILILLEDHSR